MPDNKSLSYREKYLIPFLDTHEGYQDKVYKDNNNFETIGHGFNLQDPDVSGLIKTYGKDPEKLRSGEDTLDKETADNIRNVLLDKHEKHMRDILPSFDQLNDNQKAALASKYYQLPKNFVDLSKYAAPDQEVDMMLNIVKQNIKNPGVLKRNLEVAEMYGGSQGLDNMFKLMNLEEKKQIIDSLNRIKNEHTKKEVLDKYNQYLNPKPVQFNKLLKFL